MSKRTVTKLIGSIALVSAVTMAAACEDNRGSIFIRGVVPAVLDATSGACTIDAASDTLLSGGTVDVGLTTGFTLDLSVASQLIARANQTTLTAEVNRLTISRAEVRISTSTAVRVSRFSTLVSGIVDPSADGATPGLGYVSVNVLEPATATQILDQLKASGGTAEYVAYVKLFGTTLGGNDIETDFFQYPFTACAGCLVSFPVNNGTVDCSSTTAATGLPCRIGQNSSTPCAFCKENEYCKPE